MTCREKYARPIARHVIDTHSGSSFPSLLAFCDVASNVCQALGGGAAEARGGTREAQGRGGHENKHSIDVESYSSHMIRSRFECSFSMTLLPLGGPDRGHIEDKHYTDAGCRALSPRTP